MSDNLVSQLPLNSPIVDAKGMPTRGFAIWIRDIYKRTSYKGGNAIDDNKKSADQSFITINSSLGETIEQVNLSSEAINNNSNSITETNEGLTETSNSLTSHIDQTEAHGANGDIIGSNDIATESVKGLVNRMAALALAAESTSGVIHADAPSAPASYSQSHTQELVDLSNANKASINSLVTDFNNAVIVLNNLITRNKSSGQMSE